MDNQETPLINADVESRTFGSLDRKKTDDGIDSATLRPRRRKITRKITVEPLIIFCFMTYSASAPFQQQYIYHRLAEAAGLEDSLNQNNDSNCFASDANDSDYQLRQKVQAQASTFMLSVHFCYIFPALFSVLLFGAYSDRAGRKFGLIPAQAAFFFRIGVVAATVFWDLPLWTFYPVMFLEGLMGSALCILASCFAYISDITDTTTRSRHLLIIEICMGLGLAAAQIGMGYLISNLGFQWPVTILFIISGLNLLYTVVGVPETIIRDPHVTFFSVSHFKSIYRLYAINDFQNRRWKLQMTLLIFSLTSIIDLGASEVQTLYFLNTPLCWTSILIGFFNGTSYLIKNIASMVVLALCYKRIGDLGLVLVGMLSSITYQLLLPFATETYMVFLAALAAFASMLTGVMLRSAASKLVHPDEQGALFASQSWFQLCASMVGAIAFNAIYAATLQIAHGFVFFVAAVLLFIAFILCVILFVGSRKGHRPEVLMEQEIPKEEIPSEEISNIKT